MPWSEFLTITAQIVLGATVLGGIGVVAAATVSVVRDKGGRRD